MMSVESVGLPSVVMSGDRGEIRGTTMDIVTHPSLPRETLALLWYCDYLS
jgi:hypothetical protein